MAELLPRPLITNADRVSYSGMFMDSIMLGSLAYYRRILLENVFSETAPSIASDLTIHDVEPTSQKQEHRLPALGHGIAGIMAGITVSFVAGPIEHIKARLQIQYAVDKSKRLYTGPIDCLSKIVRGTPISFQSTIY